MKYLLVMISLFLFNISVLLSSSLYADHMEDYKYMTGLGPSTFPANLSCSNGSTLKLLEVDPEADRPLTLIEIAIDYVLGSDNWGTMSIYDYEKVKVKDIDGDYHPWARVFLDEDDFGYLHDECTANYHHWSNKIYLMYKANITEGFTSCLSGMGYYSLYEKYIDQQPLKYLSVTYPLRMGEVSYYLNDQGEREFEEFLRVCVLEDCFTCQ